MKTSEVKFQFSAGDHEIGGIVVNPGSWFGKVWIIQIAIANALNPFFAVEAGSEGDAIDTFADSRFSHLIDVEESDYPQSEEDEDECGYHRAGNDGHYVCLDNVHVSAAPKDIVYRLEWPPSDDDLSSGVDSLMVEIRDEIAEEADTN